MRVSDASGSSPTSFEEAVADAVRSVRREVRAPVGVEVVRMWADLDGGAVATYRVSVRVAYRETARPPARTRR